MTGRRPADQGCMLLSDRFPSISDIVFPVRTTRWTLDGLFRWLVAQSSQCLRRRVPLIREKKKGGIELEDGYYGDANLLACGNHVRRCVSERRRLATSWSLRETIGTPVCARDACSHTHTHACHAQPCVQAAVHASEASQGRVCYQSLCRLTNSWLTTSFAACQYLLTSLHGAALLLSLLPATTSLHGPGSQVLV